jgi:hypothetical protein
MPDRMCLTSFQTLCTPARENPDEVLSDSLACFCALGFAWFDRSDLAATLASKLAYGLLTHGHDGDPERRQPHSRRYPSKNKILLWLLNVQESGGGIGVNNGACAPILGVDCLLGFCRSAEED